MERLRIIVGANVAKYHRWPGALDCRMAYVLGFARLGHEVYLVDEVTPTQCLGDDQKQRDFLSWPGLHGLESQARAYGVWERTCLVYNGGQFTHGMDLRSIVDVAREADLLVNINGKVRHEDILGGPLRRVYVDEAPAHNQVYEHEYGIDKGFSAHDVFFSFGLNVGTAHCDVPTCGYEWHPLPPPVVLDRWQASGPPHSGPFTTVSNWSGEATFRYRGRYSGEKSDNWWKFIDLPYHVRQKVEIALNTTDGYEKDRVAFLGHGWALSDPRQLRTLEDYRNFIARSRGEFSVANQRYVEFRTGWLSDRTARYLASGRPAVVQSTGLETLLPVGKGLLTFGALEDAVECMNAVDRDYELHCRAARELAEAFLDSDKVLGCLVEVATHSEARKVARAPLRDPARRRGVREA